MMRSMIATSVLVGLFLFGSSAPVRAESQISVTMFSDALSPYGDWVIVADHGRVWRPRGVAEGWRPYTIGHWAYTEFGWTWDSDWEPAWAVFHYGRWYLDPNYGWVWVPDTIWGPAWVAWSYGDEWIGWAPLPPGPQWSARIGFTIGPADLGLMIGEGAWIFVEPRYFVSTRLHTYVAPVHRNRVLLQRTRVHVAYREENGRVVNKGVPIRRVERTVGRPIVRRPIVRLESPPTVQRPSTHGVPIYRPDDREQKKSSPKGKKPRRR